MSDKLPACIEERSRDLIGLPPKDAEIAERLQLEDFIADVAKDFPKEELKGEKTYLLGVKKPRIRPHKSLLKKVDPPNRGKKRMTSVEKRKLGLTRINKSNKTFEMFIPIHKMWKEYAENALGTKHFLKCNNDDKLDHKNIEIVQNKLKKLEFFGSIIKVTQSRCSEYIGLEGIVIQESKNTFTIISIDNSIKMIPKLHSEFSFILDKFGFSIIGNHLNQRPVDKAKQNFKKHCLWL